jgi:hypothetical protein
MKLPTDANTKDLIEIGYVLPNPGRVLPDSPFWTLKVVRDRLWLLITSDGSKRSDLFLLFADKRLGAAKSIFEKGDWQLGYSVLTKAEKYLEKASLSEEANRQRGNDTSEFLYRVSLSSLKHAQMIREFVKYAPEEVKPKLIELENYPKRSFEQTRNTLLSKGLVPPENIFDWR